ncbi:GYD domain-containing protein [Massilia sp. RP-1-19]|uniref:GYD domain-containing protein n=1 Tax=Massilia polaris TaxID=2728846 RepID=A0A848HLY4_9BURK|nr:GYD domain-containing protein [Massilia polaris]NML62202.1 GYD domain-containing protein [Massilia polaris]
MPKFLFEASYLSEGLNGLIKEGGTRRRGAVDELFKSLGGAVEAFYYAFGDQDVFIIGDLPDNAAAAALAIRVNAAGVTTCKTTVLLTPTDIDEAVQRTSVYRPPGYEEQAEVAKWEGEGGHLVQGPPGGSKGKST